MGLAHVVHMYVGSKRCLAKADGTAQPTIHKRCISHVKPVGMHLSLSSEERLVRSTWPMRANHPSGGPQDSL